MLKKFIKKHFGWKKTALVLNKALDEEIERRLETERWLGELDESWCNKLKVLEQKRKEQREVIDALLAQIEKLTAERDWLSGEMRWFREGCPERINRAEDENRISILNGTITEQKLRENEQPTWPGGETGERE